MVTNTIREGLNTLLVWGAWTLWQHRNDCVFNGMSPRLSTELAMVYGRSQRAVPAG
jgi:hypothetical protein